MTSEHLAPDIGSSVVGPRHATSLRELWTDTFGRLATRALQLLLIVAVVVPLLWGMAYLGALVVPFLVAMIVAAALQPLMHQLKPRMPNALAAAIALLLGGVGVGGAVAYAITRMFAQADAVKQAAVRGLQQALDYLNHGPLPIDQAQIAQARQSVVDFFTSKEFGADAVTWAHSALELSAQFVLSLVILFFLLKDGRKIGQFLTRALNPVLRDKARRSGAQGMVVLGGYLRGTALVALVDTLLIGGALWILGVPLALALTILVFIGAFVPIVGATVSGAVAALVALVTVDLYTALWITGVVIAVNQIEGNFLAPVVLGKWMHLHSLVVLLVLSAGAVLGGISGMFLAVPMTALGWSVLKTWNAPVAHADGS